ncbi:MAG: hypothetical protein KDD45_03410 [Bdellovibrionales bacterium]|nr:hypothetical protein [Bdellovibrionales bacterium]
MLNGSKTQNNKEWQKNFIVDYRNAKYQGEISEYERIPSGLGILLSIDYHAVIAHWQEGVINGPCCIFYPSGSLFYGSISNSQLKGINVLQFSNLCTVWTFANGSGNHLAIMDSLPGKTITAIQVPKREIEKIISNRNKGTT